MFPPCNKRVPNKIVKQEQTSNSERVNELLKKKKRLLYFAQESNRTSRFKFLVLACHFRQKKTTNRSSFSILRKRQKSIFPRKKCREKKRNRQRKREENKNTLNDTEQRNQILRELHAYCTIVSREKKTGAHSRG